MNALIEIDKLIHICRFMYIYIQIIPYIYIYIYTNSHKYILNMMPLHFPWAPSLLFDSAAGAESDV